jgi:putative salt-induced outer membrane protein YdiY
MTIKASTKLTLLISLFLAPLTQAQQEIAEEQTTSGAIVEALEKIKEEPKAKPPLTGTVELGFLYKTGDVKSYDIKSRVDLINEFDRWRNNYVFDVLIKQTEEEITLDDGSTDKQMLTTDQKWFIDLQSNYYRNETKRNYFFGRVFYEDDRFSSFEYQSSMAAGWGKRWYENLNSGTYLDAEIGPGFSHDKLIETETIDSQSVESETSKDAFIIRSSMTYFKKLYDTVDFKQTIGADIATKSGENTKIKAITSFTTLLIGSLAARITFTLDHNTEVDDESENTNTETNLTFVYSF